MSEDEQVTSSVTEEEEGTAEASAETKKTEDGPKPNYVPQSRLNEMAEQKRAALAEAEELREEIEQMKAESAIHTPDDVDPATKEAKELIRETVDPLIERQLADLRKEVKTAKKELADVRKETSRSSQEIQWQKTCEKIGADPDNKEFIAVTAGLARLDLTMEDAAKRALAMLPGAARSNTGSGKGASVETAGFDGVPSTSDWVPKSDSEARQGAAKGKIAKQLSSSEILALRKEKRA